MGANLEVALRRNWTRRLNHVFADIASPRHGSSRDGLERMHYTSAMPARMTPAATAAALGGAKAAAEDPVDVVLELKQPAIDAEGNRGERIARQKAVFKTLAGPVKAAVVEHGGTVEAEAWINCTIKARVPARALERLKEVDGIVTIDLPHQVTRD